MIGLNMIDVAQQEHLEIDAHVLEAAIGVPVVPMVAARNQVCVSCSRQWTSSCITLPHTTPMCPKFVQTIVKSNPELENLIKDAVPSPYPHDWVAFEAFRGGCVITKLIHGVSLPRTVEAVHDVLVEHDDGMMALPLDVMTGSGG